MASNAAHGTQTTILRMEVEQRKQLFYTTPSVYRHLPKQPNHFCIQHVGFHIEPQKTLERQLVLYLILRLIVRKIVQRLQNQNIEHHNAVERRTISKNSLFVSRAPCLIDKHLLWLVIPAQFLITILKIKKTRLTQCTYLLLSS